VARVALDHWHSQQGARFSDSEGWRIPTAYTSADQEIAAARAGVGFFDLSAFAKIRFSGRAVPGVIDRIIGGSPAPRTGSAFPLHPDGALLGCRLTEDQLLVLAATPDVTRVRQSLAHWVGDLAVEEQEVTCSLAGLHLMGPKSDMLLRRLSPFDVSRRAFPAGSCAETGCAGIHATLVRDPDCAGLAAVRIYVSWEFGEYLLEVLVELGRSLGIVPIGAEAWGRLLGSSQAVDR
jgi:heterotetrameric sarcosine oxidase gamma subunit